MATPELDAAVAPVDDEPLIDAAVEGRRRTPDAGVTVVPDAGPTSGPGIAAGVRWVGRVDVSDPDMPRFSWSGTGFIARFTGTGLSVRLKSTGAPLRYKAVVDYEAQETFVAAPGEESFVLASDLPRGEHIVELYRQTEGSQGDSQLLAITVERGNLLPPQQPSDRLIEIVGDSISAGYGNLGAVTDKECLATESHWDSYGVVTAHRVDANLSTIAVSGIGVSRSYQGNTRDQMVERYERTRTNAPTPRWTFEEQPQAVVINLGTNDFGESKTDPGDAFDEAYVALLEKVRSKNPNARIVCTIGPMLADPALSQIEERITRAVERRQAAGDDKVSTFFGFETQPRESYACQYHPNVEQHARMADALEGELRRLLNW